MRGLDKAGISEKAGSAIPTPVLPAQNRSTLRRIARKPHALPQSKNQLRILSPADPPPATFMHIPQTVKEE